MNDVPFMKSCFDCLIDRILLDFDASSKGLFSTTFSDFFKLANFLFDISRA